MCLSRIFRDYPNPPHLAGTGICLFVTNQAKTVLKCCSAGPEGLSHSHGELLLQVLPAPCGEAADHCCSQPALPFPWLSLKEHFPALPAPSTTFVTGRDNQTCSGLSEVVCVPWKRSWCDLDCGIEIIQAHPVDGTSPGHPTSHFMECT